MTIPRLQFADQLKTACNYCTTFARAPAKNFVERGLVPLESDDTATVTFISLDNRTYAVTAWHVIEIFQRQAQAEGVAAEGYFLPSAPGQFLQPPFVQPPGNFPQRTPDIALTPVPSDLPARIGKEAFEVLEATQPSYPVSHALAVGFPTASKLATISRGTERLELPCARAVAEGVGSSDVTADQVQFYSPLDELPEVKTLSGMSGGPVFWSDENECGLLGFVKEAPECAPSAASGYIESSPRVQFICQRATYDDLVYWCAYADREWPKRRAQLCRANASCT